MLQPCRPTFHLHMIISDERIHKAVVNSVDIANARHAHSMAIQF